MNRKQLILTLVTFYCTTFSAVLLWMGLAYLNSTPTAFAEVKGASTDTAILASAPAKVSVSNYPVVPSNASQPVIYAKQYALFNVESGKVVAESSNLDPVPIASTTKLMTSHLVSKYGHLDDIVTVSENAASQTGSLAYVHVGEKITVRNLLYCMLLVSGNDAAHALAEYTGGVLLNDQNASIQAKTDRFVQEMNTEAARLNMQNTHYMDPAGLNDAGHSTAVDLAKIASLDIADRNLQPVMNTASTTVYDQSGYYRHDLNNSDRLVNDYHYEGSLGGKTGNTDAAGHCLVSAAERDGHTLIAVILNTYSSAADASALQARTLLDWGFATIQWQ